MPRYAHQAAEEAFAEALGRAPAVTRLTLELRSTRARDLAAKRARRT